MAVGDVQELAAGLFHPRIRHNLPAGRAESRLAGVGDDALDSWVGRTAVEVVSCLQRIAAPHYLLHFLNDARTHVIPVLREEERPVILEDLFERVRASECFKHYWLVYAPTSRSGINH